MEINDKRALVYIHIFADGSKYFGNAVSIKRPWDFKNNRNGKWLTAFAEYGAPVVQIRQCLTVSEADNLERWLFDKYIANGGVKLQTRPNGVALTTLSTANNGVKKSSTHRTAISLAQLGAKLSDTHKANISAGNLGKKRSIKGRANISASLKGKASKANRKVVSVLDGRVTTANHSSRWDKKNPAYIGTWSDYIEE